MQLMHLSGSISMCSRDRDDIAPSIMPIGHTSVHHILPLKKDSDKMSKKETIPHINPIVMPIPKCRAAASESEGCQMSMMLRKICHGSRSSDTMPTPNKEPTI